MIKKGISSASSPINNKFGDLGDIKESLSIGAQGWLFGRKKEEIGDMAPIAGASRALQEKVKAFPKPIEIAGYLIGVNNDKLTHIVLPTNVIGIDIRQSGVHKRSLEELTDIFSKTTTMLAVKKGTNELGLQIIAAKPNVPEDRSQFFQANQLILDRHLSYLLSETAMTQLFPGLTRDQITDEHLVAAVRNSSDKRQHTYFKNGDSVLDVEYLPVSLGVDMFGSERALHPINEFILSGLSRNKFEGGGAYGLLHTHYTYTPEEVSRDTHLQELTKIDRNFVELITPYDANQLMRSRATIKNLRKEWGEWRSRERNGINGCCGP